MTNSYQAGDVAISGLPALPQNSLATADELAIVDVDAQETKKIGTEAFFLGALSLLPPGSIDGNLIVYSTPPSITAGQIPDGSITAVKLADNSAGIFASSLPASGDFTGQTCILTDGSVYVWTGSAWLSAVSSANQVTAADLADNSSGVWTSTGSAPGSNGNFIGQIAVATNGKAYMWNGSSWYALTADVLDGSITGVKLADSSSARFYSGTNSLTGEYIGQLAIDSASGTASAWTGTAWVNLSGDVYTGVAGSVVDINIDAATRQISASLQNTSAAGQFLAGPSGAAGAASYRAIAAADLPTAATGTAGIVTPGTTLAVTNGTLDLAVQGTAQTADYHLVTYNEYGIVTGSAALSDTIVIPPATATDLGGIIAGAGLAVDANGTLSVDFTANTTIASTTTLGTVMVGGGLSITGTGTLSIGNSVTAGTFTKVTIDAYGLVTTGDFLTDTDIPDLDASKLITGTLDPLRIADGSITRDKLANYAVTYIQEVAPTLNIGPTGVFWLKESTGELYAYNGNRWIAITGSGGLNQPVTGFRYGGMVDGSTGNLIAVSDEGIEAGFADGTALAGIVTASNVGIYFAVHVAGSSIGVIPNQTVAIGDWVLAASETDGWLYLDRSGTGAIIDPSQITLDELADVDADTPVDGDCLIYDGTNQIYETRKIVVSEIGDVVLTSPSQGQVLQYDATNSNWINGAGTAPVVSENPPASPINDMLWVRPSTRRQYVYVTDTGGSSQWVSLACC